MIMCDLRCPKCGRIGTVFIPDSYKGKMYKLIEKDKYFNFPVEDVFTEKEFMNIFVKN